MRKIMKWLFLLFYLSLIFYMSHQEGSASSKNSDGIFYFFYQIFPILETKKEIVTFLIRKSAHILEYVILGLCIWKVVEEYVFDRKKLVIFSFLFCFFCASVDEIHQLFVEGRAGMVSDVLIDSAGAVLGLGILILIQSLIGWLWERKNRTHVHS